MDQDSPGQDNRSSVESCGSSSSDHSTVSHRTRIVQELLSTERTYVRNLYILVKEFLLPLQNVLGTDEEIISKKKVDRVFSNIEEVYNSNVRFLRELETRVTENWDDTSSTVGDLFDPQNANFQSYFHYVKTHGDGLACMRKLEKKIPWTNFIMRVKEKGQAGKLDLPAYLIQPVQRIPRYELLLKDLLRHTEALHIDFQNLTNALEIVHALATTVNEALQREENVKKLVSIEKSITGLTKDIVSEEREFLKEGAHA
eukprot:TRINITY_DN1524_c2_g1_i1.p1 TRINITY_DN1524_c2_g1~~TRINITY_DN1524_c2_g1_i1.p1  ORF type:complete len:257 (+),score=63.58 TRINITY_DN1524_c2_g1_i1:49-819(+)